MAAGVALGVAIGVVLIGLLFAPPYVRQRITIPVMAVFGNRAASCFDHYRDNFKDPFTAYLVRSYELPEDAVTKYNAFRDSDEAWEIKRVLRIEVRVRNSFGAYGEEQLDCALNEHGYFDSAGTILLRIRSLSMELQKK